MADPSQYYGTLAVAPLLQRLGEADATDGALVDAIFGIIDLVLDRSLG